MGLALTTLIFRSVIRGESGLGKTRLAETIRPHVVGDDGFFVRGKFDRINYGCASRPFSGIASCFADYCDEFERKGEATWQEMSNSLKKFSQEESEALIEAIPSLQRIIEYGKSKICVQNKGEERAAAAESWHGNHSNNTIDEGRSHRLAYSIKKVMSTICSTGDTMCFLIDDVQWANKSDLDLLRAMMTSAKVCIITGFVN